MFEEVDSNATEDNEQKNKELLTLQLLVSAGYFRARIKGLSTFNKVVGGMTWCIQGCSMNIDIDLLFQENWNIGRKIALTEKLVRVLKKMNCPHRIEPHQIQGSDFIHIYSVVQWLVKQTLGKQDERMAEMKVIACQYFDRTDKRVDIELRENNSYDKTKIWNCDISPLQDCTNVVEYLEKAYFPQRKFKKPNSLKNVSEEVSVMSTLLEYGRKEILGSISNASGNAGDRSSVSQEKQVDSLEDVVDINVIQNQMSSQVKETTKMTGKLVSQLMERKFGDVRDALEDYEAKSTILTQSSPKKVDYWKNATSNLQLKLEEVTEKSLEVETQINSVRENISEIKNRMKIKLVELNEYRENFEESIKNYPEEIKIEDVQEMVMTLDRLKEEEQQLKSTYKKEDVQLNEKLLKLSNEDEPIEDEEQVSALEESLNNHKKRLQNGRLRLATKTRELKQLELFLDDIPSKREIQQYQKRFVELNTEISNAFSENKQLYDMYNILDSVKDCLSREVNLLNSIHENFKESIQNYSAKEQIFQQMKEAANTIRGLKKNGENQKEKTKADRDQKKEEYNAIVDKSRQYAKLTKNLQETWQYYEKLDQKCNELGLKSQIENEI